MARRRKVKASPDCGTLRLYEVTFSARAEETVLVLAHDEDEAMEIADEPDTFDVDVDWDCDGSEEVDSKALAKLIREHGPGHVCGVNPVTEKPITLEDWQKFGPEIEAAAKKQAEFDALPKLFPDVAPKLIVDVIMDELPEEAR